MWNTWYSGSFNETTAIDRPLIPHIEGKAGLVGNQCTQLLPGEWRSGSKRGDVQEEWTGLAISEVAQLLEILVLVECLSRRTVALYQSI